MREPEPRTITVTGHPHMTRCTPGQSALALQSVRGDLDAAFAGFFWSHVPLAEIDGFLEALMLRLLPGSLVVFADNRLVAGSVHPGAGRSAYPAEPLRPIARGR